VSTSTGYSIKDVATLTGLPASTLRYYESIGVIAPVSRGASSRHRVYDEADLDRLIGVACLAATGMSVNDMRQYVANNELGPDAASEQRRLLTEQRERLEHEAASLVLRQRYVALKIRYWDAVEAGDTARAAEITTEAHRLAVELRTSQ
jgi:DNA-binding transcriptional MerR regulator